MYSVSEMEMMNGISHNIATTTEIYRIGTDIVFCAEIDDITAHKVIRLIREAVVEVQDAVEKARGSIGTHSKLVDMIAKPITLHLTTNGGVVSSAWAVVDTILKSPVDIHTVICGFVASSGTLISAAGKKRFMQAHACALIHEVRGSSWGKISDLRDQYANTDKIMNLVVKFYTEKTKKEEELRTMLTRDKYWDAHECLEAGLVDEIM